MKKWLTLSNSPIFGWFILLLWVNFVGCTFQRYEWCHFFSPQDFANLLSFPEEVTFMYKWKDKSLVKRWVVIIPYALMGDECSDFLGMALFITRTTSVSIPECEISEASLRLKQWKDIPTWVCHKTLVMARLLLMIQNGYLATSIQKYSHPFYHSYSFESPMSGEFLK